MPDPAFTMISWLVLGGTLGWIDGRLVRVPEREPIFLHIAVGGAAGLAGGYIADLMVRARHGSEQWYVSFVAATVAAVVVLGLWRAVLRGTGSVGKSH